MSRPSQTATSAVALEVSPRVAKVMAAKASPFQIQRVNASLLSAQSEDPIVALRTLLSAQPLGTRQVGLVFGRETVSLRTLELPSSDPKEIASMLELQLGKLTPYPRAEILSAWTMIGSLREGYTSVLLAIARKTLVEGVLQLLKTKGVTPQWVGVSTEGLESWWRRLPPRGNPPSPGEVTALIDVDGTSTDCAILSNDRLLFTQNFAIGYDQLAASEEATLRWLGELVRLPRILLHEDIKGQISRGVVTGMTKGIEKLTEQLASQWGVPVEVLDSFAPFAPSATVSQQATASRVSFTALAGLLASGTAPRLDLIPQEARTSQALHVRSKHLTRLAGSLGVILMLAGVLYAEQIFMLRLHLTQLRKRLAVEEQVSRDIMQRQHAMRAIRDWLNPARSASEAFRSVAAAADSQITVTQIAIEEGKPVTIRGKTATMAGAFAFADRLKQQGVFQNITARPVLRPKSASELGAEFEMLCEWAT